MRALTINPLKYEIEARFERNDDENCCDMILIRIDESELYGALQPEAMIRLGKWLIKAGKESEKRGK